MTLERNQDPDNAIVQSVLGSMNSKLAVGLVIGKLPNAASAITVADDYHRKQKQDSQPRSSSSI